MGDGTRLAIAILVFWIALVFFFFAFHPGGVSLNGANVSNPGQMLKFLVDEFGKLAGGNSSTAAGSTSGAGGGGKVVATADVTSTNAANYPGYTSNSDAGSATPQGVQVV